jgi:hypothetical protein
MGVILIPSGVHLRQINTVTMGWAIPLDGDGAGQREDGADSAIVWSSTLEDHGERCGWRTVENSSGLSTPPLNGLKNGLSFRVTLERLIEQSCL